MWEIVIASTISSAMFLIGLFILQRNKEQTLKINKEYELELIREKAKQNRKNKKVSAELVQHNTKAPRSIFEQLKGLDTNKIRNIIDMLQGSDYEIEGEGDNLLDGLMGFAQNNPDVVQGLLEGLNNPKKKDGDINYE